VRAFASVDDVQAALAGARYAADRALATSVFLALRLGKPLLVEGPPGVGKTELAKAIAAVLSAELLRLQCYEGLDEAKALYEWEYPKQLLYTQLLSGKIGELTAGAGTLAEAVERLAAHEDAFFSRRFLLARPLLAALTRPAPVVLLLDEVDRAEAELEAFFLELLAEFQVTIPELGTIRAESPPVVVLTSNDSRELSDALRRRCLHVWLDFPTPARELEIVRLRLPDAGATLAAEAVRVVQAIRGLDLKKRPSVAETLDWLRALVALSADVLSPQLVEDSLSLLLKHAGDRALVVARLPSLLTS
jgi:MoxR-like ATPase